MEMKCCPNCGNEYPVVVENRNRKNMIVHIRIMCKECEIKSKKTFTPVNNIGPRTLTTEEYNEKMLARAIEVWNELVVGDN
jgi:transcriptional regulator NrdR family protein